MESATIGQYRVTGTIGRGGMGAVYAGEHVLLGRPAAIKVLLPELSQKQDVVMRFFNEARAATAIRHPGIIEIYDFGWTETGAAFIVMEHLEGETLGQRASRTRFLWPAALAIARQIAGALSAAHAKGIVHRDLKPDNVYLVPDPEVPGGERIKLLDFGIAKLAAESSGTPNVTRTGAVMGTPTYMAPEQCRGVAVDHRADLYALGCVIYELCCGRPPFLGEGTGDVLAAHIHVPVPEMTGAASEIPPPVQHLVRRLLAKLPADRVQSADELIRAIDAVTLDRSTAAAVPRRAGSVSTSPTLTTLSGSASIRVRMPRPGGRRRWPVAVVSAALAAITVLVVALVMRGGGEPGGSVPAAVLPSTSPASGATPGEPSAALRDPPPAAPPSAPVRAPADSTLAGAHPAASPTGSPAEPAASPGTPAATPAPADPPAPRPGPPAGAAPQEPERSTIDLVVDSVPPGAQVSVDDTVLGTTPYRGVLPRRDRDARIVLRLAGHVDKTVVVSTARPITEHLRLARVPAPAAPPRARTNRDKSVNPFD